MSGRRTIKTLKVGDLVLWEPDGDMGVVTDVNEHEVRYQTEDTEGVEDYEPYWIQGFNDPVASGWHDYCPMLLLLCSP